MKYKGERIIMEVPLINLLRPESLRKLNAIFNTTYHPEKLRSLKTSIVWATIVQSLEQVENNEIDKLMRMKPERGGWNGV